MQNYKNETIKLAIIFFCLIMTSLIILQDLYTTYNISSGIDKNLKQRHMSEVAYTDAVKMISTINESMSSHNQLIATEFRDLSSDVIKRQMEFYSSVDSPRKNETLELIESTRSYVSFVEKDLIPASLSGNVNLSQVQSKHNDLSIDLLLKAGALYESDRRYEAGFLHGIRNKGYKYLFLQVLLIFTLSLLIIELYKLTKPVMIKNHYLDKIFQSINNPLLVANHRGELVDCNKGFCELMKIDQDSVKNQNINRLAAAYPHAHNIMQPIYDVMIHGKELTNYHVTYYHSGKKVELVADYIPLYLMRRLFGVVVVASHAEAQKDKHVLLDTLETERKRISIEIHDWIGRNLSTVIHSLDYILRSNGNDTGEKLEDSLKVLQSHCQNAAIEMRGIMNDIHPYLIDRVGLISALESYITTFERLYNIKVYALYQDRSVRVKKKDEIIIYRIIQEALINVTKHSKATEIDIDFTVSHDTLKIEVSDNGGTSGEFMVGNGLWGMKERANLIGGDIIFASTESGFRVVLTVPVIAGGA